MQYDEALDYMESQLPMFHRIGKSAYKAKLGNALVLDEYFGHPHKKFSSVHVAGTNGKGSTSHMLASVLQQAGYRVGLYTSPHLKDFRERIRVNGEMISQDEVTQFVEEHRKLFDRVKPSFFEMTVAMAFDYFARQNVDVAVVEVGLGGRLDSTNIITPIISVITSIGLDHTDLLGNTLPQIAGEKAGIIKRGVPVVISQFQPETASVFTSKASEMQSSIVFADSAYKVQEMKYTGSGMQTFLVEHGESMEQWDTDLMGSYQRLNLPGVLASLDILREEGYRITLDAQKQGLRMVQQLTGLMGRWQKLQDRPLIYCDTGHNVDGITMVMEQIHRMSYAKLHVVLGMVADKDIDGMLSLLPADAIYYFTRAALPRALDQNVLMAKAMLHGLMGEAYPTVTQALEAAKDRADENDLIYVGGSTFVVAEVV
jgi:dihydrofolate synthase/folylpolyglutamate synthase